MIGWLRISWKLYQTKTFRRICCYIGNSRESFGSLTALDKCAFDADAYDFLIPKDAESAEATIRRLQEVERKTSPALVVVEVPQRCPPYGIVNILGYLQDLQIRLKSTCVLLIGLPRSDSVITERLAKYYKLTTYRASRWDLKTLGGDTVFSLSGSRDRRTGVS